MHKRQVIASPNNYKSHTIDSIIHCFNVNLRINESDNYGILNEDN